MDFEHIRDADAERWAAEGRPIEQGDKSKDIELRISLSFRLRPAGWMGNDGHMVTRIVNFFTRYLQPLAERELNGDERLSVSSEWRRVAEGRDSQWIPVAESR